MHDAKKQFKVYKRTGGVSNFDMYKENLKLFYYHTINSHCGGITPDIYDGASTDPDGFALYDSREAGEAAFMDAAKIGYAELCRIFKSVDAVHPYS